MASHQESFTGVDGTTPAGWSNRYNSIVIKSNQGSGGDDYSDNIGVYTGKNFGPNQYAKVTIKRAVGANPSAIAVGVRCGSSYNGIWAYYDGSQVIVQDDLGGSLQTLAGVTYGVGDVLELRAVGTHVQVFKNGVAAGDPVAVKVHYLGKNCGLDIKQPNGYACVDDFECGDLNTGVTEICDLLFDFEDADDDDAVSGSNVEDLTKPSPIFGVVTVTPDPAPYLKVKTAAKHAYDGTVAVAGQTIDLSASAKGLQFDYAAQGVSRIEIDTQQYPDDVSIGFFFRTTLEASHYTPRTLVELVDSGGTEYACFSLNYDGGEGIPVAIETYSEDFAGPEIQPNTWYWVTLQRSVTANKARLAIYLAATMAQIGSTVEGAFGTSPLRYIRFGGNDNHGSWPAAGTVHEFDSIMIDVTDGTFPLLPTANLVDDPPVIITARKRKSRRIYIPARRRRH